MAVENWDGVLKVQELTKKLEMLTDKKKHYERDLERETSKLKDFEDTGLKWINVSFNHGGGNDWLYNSSFNEEMFRISDKAKNAIIEDYNQCLDKIRKEIVKTDKLIEKVMHEIRDLLK